MCFCSEGANGTVQMKIRNQRGEGVSERNVYNIMKFTPIITSQHFCVRRINHSTLPYLITNLSLTGQDEL